LLLACLLVGAAPPAATGRIHSLEPGKTHSRLKILGKPGDSPIWNHSTWHRCPAIHRFQGRGRRGDWLQRSWFTELVESHTSPSTWDGIFGARRRSVFCSTVCLTVHVLCQASVLACNGGSERGQFGLQGRPSFSAYGNFHTQYTVKLQVRNSSQLPFPVLPAIPQRSRPSRSPGTTSGESRFDLSGT
jgi:hypothetical protein